MTILKPTVDLIKTQRVVKSWLKDLSANSKESYLEALAEFCIVNDTNPEKMLKIIHKEEEERLPAWDRSINVWFEDYDECCKEKERSKSTRDTRRTIVNAFIGFHGMPQYLQRGRRRKVEGLKDPKIRANLTKDDISQLIGVCKSFKMKAVILAQASSGLAISDLLNLKLSDFKEGIQKVYDDNDEPCRICQLSLERKKTHVKFTTFFSEEAVEAIETYLEFERLDVNDDGALFSRYQSGGNHMSTMAIQHSYRELNRFLGWVPDEGGFYKATSHMMRKFFNTQLINAGMPWEIREHMMGHKLKDRVREAYFLADPEELKKVYLRYIEHLTVKDSTSGKYSQDEFRELQRQNSRLCDTVAEMKKELKELKGEV